MAIDWKLYERDVNRWYIDEGKTANEVIQLLHENHNLRVTTRQFKFKFGGCKKISSKEWSILIPKLREREANHLKSIVYVCGKAIKQETVTRSMRRYSKLCRGGSQPDTVIDLGIDTIGQHRIEIRAPSESGAQLPCDISAAEVQHRNEGENFLNFQSDDLDIDEEFGPVEMDAEPYVSAFVETAVYPSSSMFPGSLDQLQETFSFSDTHENQMRSDGTALFSSQLLPISPSIDLTTMLPFQPAFTSFWESLDILSPTMSGFEAVNITDLIGTFVPDHRWQRFIPKLNIGTEQTKALKPIIQLIEELMTPMGSNGFGNRARLNFSPNLLDVVKGQPLGQALSVIVYMISNNLLDDEENFRIICWILKMGHVPNLLVFSQLPAVRHLAFGSAFLRAVAKIADRLVSSNVETMCLIGDFVSSMEFLSLVKSHHEDISDPLGTMLFRLAIETDSMELAKLLGSLGTDVRSDAELLDDPHLILDLAADRRRHSMLQFIVSLVADINQSFPGGPALESAIWNGNHFAAQTLLDAGVVFPDQIHIPPASHRSPEIHALLEKHLGHDSSVDYRKLILAAQKDNRELSQASYGIISPHDMEQAMCMAIESLNLAATRTFLQRKTDPNVGMVALLKHLSSMGMPFDWFPSDAIYLLVQAGAQVSGETALSVRRSLDSSNVDSFRGHGRLLRVLLEAGYDEAWVHQYLLTSCAEEGFIFECDACIDSGTPINGYGLRGQSALSIAAGRGHLALVQHLVSRGAAPNLPPSSDHSNGESALYAALARGHWEVSAYLIESGCDVTTRATTWGATFLEGVVFEIDGDVDKSEVNVNTYFRNLLALGAPVNRLNSTASFLIHGLLDMNQPDCLELALQAGARAEDKFMGMTPIQLAALRKDSGAIQLLLQHGANINGCDRLVGNNTPISEMPLPHFDTPHFRKSLENNLRSRSHSSGFLMGVFADNEPYFPHTPLQLASSAYHSDLDFVKFLLSQGADVNTPAAEWHGRTALQGAISAEKLNMEVIELLLRQDANVNAPPAQVGGVTALQGAAIRGDIQLVSLLLEKGADINAPGAPDEGRTALEGAAEHGRMEMLRFLLSKGAMPDFITGYSTAIELAEEEMHVGIAKFLGEEQRKLHGVGWGLGPLQFDLVSLVG